VTSRPRAQLLLPVRNRAAFLDAYFSKAPRTFTSTPPAAPPGDTEEGAPISTEGEVTAGGMFVPGELDVALGEECDVELVFQEEHVRFHIRAVVKWKRTQPGRRALPPGVGIEFLASEVRTQEQILRFAEGKESVSHVDRARRWTLQVDVKLTGEGGTIVGVTDDISAGGCFVLTDAPLVIGSRVDVKLRSPGTLFGWLTVAGVVSWRRVQPDRTGVGIELKFESERQQRAMQRILDVVKARALRDVRVKVPRMTTPPTEA
jgi:uncharacterized protein (TIGR02266 family)